MPFDAHLRPGGVIDVTNEMSPKTRRRLYEIAACDRRALRQHHPGTARAAIPVMQERPKRSLSLAGQRDTQMTRI